MGLHDQEPKVLPSSELLLCQFGIQHGDGPAVMLPSATNAMGFEDASRTESSSVYSLQRRNLVGLVPVIILHEADVAKRLYLQHPAPY